LVQTYVEEQEVGEGITSGLQLPLLPTSRKRKTPDHEHEIERSQVNIRGASGLLSPLPSHVGSVSPKMLSPEFDVLVYNGVLKRKCGRIFASHLRRFGDSFTEIDATSLPNADMTRAARLTPLVSTARAIRLGFLEKLRRVNGLYLENKVDSTTPPLHFRFIKEYVYLDDQLQTSNDAFVGCQQCRPNMGQNIGCEYTQKCDCLEYANVDEEKLKSTNLIMYNKYIEDLKTSGQVDTLGLPKRFPYTKPNLDNPNVPQKLLAYYRESRYPIYECNHKCRCGPRCKSRLVQKGRKVPLTIFKTDNKRGWGVYCNEDLVQGQFIDTYLGEVITSQEADRREADSGSEKNSYLYALDKFVGEGGITEENCLVIDGQYMGGPTRFINHSCEPNCRQYTVSYNKYDNRLYNLAFFAYENIPAGVELTFDYMDLDEVEEDEAIRLREAAMKDPRNAGRVPCNCGTVKCRGFLWDQSRDEA
jgi:histone-lysine N-methyltransferase SUV39H